MANGEELLNQLINGADPYRPATNMLSQWRYDPVKAGDKGIGTSAAVGLGQVLLTQMLNNESMDFRANQRKALSSVMPTLRNNPLGATRPEGLNSDVFESARAINLENFLDTAQKLAIDNFQFQRDLGKQSQGNREQAILSALNNNPRAKYDPDWVISNFDKLVGGATGSAPAARVTDDSEPVAKKDTYESRAGMLKEDPESALSKELRSLEQDYTKTLFTGNEARAALAVNKAASNILQAIQRNDPQSAATAIFEFAKLNDPQGTVREADEMRVADPGGPLGTLAQIHNQMMGQGKLTPEAKKGLEGMIPILLNSQFNQYNQIKDGLLEATKQYGADPSRVKYIKPLDVSSLVDNSSTLQAIIGGSGNESEALAEARKLGIVK